MLLKVNNKGTALLAVAEQMATQCEKIFVRRNMQQVGQKIRLREAQW